MSENKALLYVLLGATAGSLATIAFTQVIGCKRSSNKLVNIRRVGDRTGRPMAASCWADILNMFPGSHPRVFLPNGDEVLEDDRSDSFFQLLPSQQLLYVAPNGEDFNPIEVLERLDEQQMQSQVEMYHRLLEVCFKNVVPRFSDSEMASKPNGLNEYIEYCVTKYLEVSKSASVNFFSPPQS